MTDAFGRSAGPLTPRIYGGSELGVLALTAPGDVHPRVEYVGGDLFVGLDDHGVAVTQGEVERWSRPFRDAVREALPSDTATPDAADGVIVVRDEVAAAALLVDPARLPGSPQTPVVFALARDRVAIVGAGDEAAVGRVLDLAEELFAAGGPLVSAHPVAPAGGADGGWAPFPWRERYASLTPRFERVLRLFSVRAYEAQSVALQRPDVHFADPKIQVLDTGVTVTIAAWPKGTATLLPVVDNVIVADPAGTLSVATFDQFLDAGGDAIIRTGLSPLRYFVPGEPPRNPGA
ncbi:MAG: hypothetical protein QM622_10855 [Microbacterium sp.]